MKWVKTTLVPPTSLLLLTGMMFGSALTAHPLPAVRWTMINVNGTAKQGDAHLLELDGRAVFLIDSGSGEDHGLLRYLAKRKITHLQKVFITHMHEDHYGGVLALLDSGIRIDEVYFNLPPRETCQKETPWGCDYPTLLKWIQTLKKRGVRTGNLPPGRVYTEGKTELTVLYSYLPGNAPVSINGVNDMSAIMLLRVGNTRALLTGDLDRPLARYLTLHGRNLQAQIFKVPHHGTEGVAENEFFDRVAPTIALVPSPKGLWLSERSQRIRRYFDGKKIPTYVNGIDGDVTVSLTPEEFCVETEKSSPPAGSPKCFPSRIATKVTASLRE